MKKGEAGSKKKVPTTVAMKSPTIVSTIPPSTEIPFLKAPVAEKEDPLKFFFWT